MSIQIEACDLRRGDVIIDGNWRNVVKSVAHTSTGTKVEVLTAGGALESLYLAGGNVVTVEASDRRVTDAEIDQLVEATRELLEITDSTSPLWVTSRREKLAKLVDRLSPVEAPTLAEALGALRVLTNEGAVGVHLNAAKRLLDRARRAGVMP